MSDRLRLKIQTQTDAGTITFGTDVRAVTVEVAAGVPVWGGAVLAVGTYTSPALALGDKLVNVPPVVCTSGDTVNVISVVPD